MYHWLGKDLFTKNISVKHITLKSAQYSCTSSIRTWQTKMDSHKILLWVHCYLQFSWRRYDFHTETFLCQQASDNSYYSIFLQLDIWIIHDLFLLQIFSRGPPSTVQGIWWPFMAICSQYAWWFNDWLCGTPWTWMPEVIMVGFRGQGVRQGHAFCTWKAWTLTSILLCHIQPMWFFYSGISLVLIRFVYLILF